MLEGQSVVKVQASEIGICGSGGRFGVGRVRFFVVVFCGFGVFGGGVGEGGVQGH